jgi:hypothetical protein
MIECSKRTVQKDQEYGLLLTAELDPDSSPSGSDFFGWAFNGAIILEQENGDPLPL